MLSEDFPAIRMIDLWQLIASSKLDKIWHTYCVRVCPVMSTCLWSHGAYILALGFFWRGFLLIQIFDLRLEYIYSGCLHWYELVLAKMALTEGWGFDLDNVCVHLFIIHLVTLLSVHPAVHTFSLPAHLSTAHPHIHPSIHLSIQ